MYRRICCLKYAAVLLDVDELFFLGQSLSGLTHFLYFWILHFPMEVDIILSQFATYSVHESVAHIKCMAVFNGSL